VNVFMCGRPPTSVGRAPHAPVGLTRASPRCRYPRPRSAGFPRPRPTRSATASTRQPVHGGQWHHRARPDRPPRLTRSGWCERAMTFPARLARTRTNLPPAARPGEAPPGRAGLEHPDQGAVPTRVEHAAARLRGCGGGGGADIERSLGRRRVLAHSPRPLVPRAGHPSARPGGGLHGSALCRVPRLHVHQNSPPRDRARARRDPASRGGRARRETETCSRVGA
jgi:hypothetical protein